jgi:hypothetical protein
MRKQATAGDMIARMQAKATQDEHMAIIKEKYAPWQPGEWEELLATANADRAEARKTFAFLAEKAQA